MLRLQMKRMFFIINCLSYVYMHVYDMYMVVSLHVNVAKPPTVLLLVDKVSTLEVHIAL